jgi:hypothetical protein
MHVIEMEPEEKGARYGAAEKATSLLGNILRGFERYSARSSSQVPGQSKNPVAKETLQFLSWFVGCPMVENMKALMKPEFRT